MIIELLNGTRFDIADYNLKRLYHYIPSATIEHNSVSIDGRSDIILNSKINNRVISVDFIYQSEDIFDFYLLREEINALFLREESYYIIFKNEPHKRWLVKVNNQYNLQPNQRLESFTVEFITLNSYAESIATTQTLKEWDIDSWSWNGAIDWDDGYNYSFNQNNFIVKNLGNVTVDPRYSFLEVNIEGNFNSFIDIFNSSTRQSFRADLSMRDGDVLKLTGIRTLLNNTSILRNTNRNLITLLPGDNVFTVEGGTISNISFDFRFLYK